ncbi:MAG: AmmeMemoRadiSam system radical SAM enzyme [Promethearchaeota archaeon]|nr:MAG: AmmeMemoRadiSam system radical SAM enzyme [Candidatus Lokiarchaeota archaeon]
MNMELIRKDFIKKGKYQQKINKNLSQCLTCERRCKISEGKSGICGTRMNLNNEIYSIVYGCAPALSFNPIEKKPLFHFYPGSVAMTVGTYGCNFDCFWCQNHHLSHPEGSVLEKIQKEKEYLSPEKFIQIAKKNNCQGTSISFNEPTLLFEYSLDVFKLANKEGLYNTYVSNGYMTENVLKDLIKAGLDAINIDIKGDASMVEQYCGADIERVWRNAKMAKKMGVHVEITTLLIQKFNTDETVVKKIAERILNDLGAYTPFHMTRFMPHYKSYQYNLSNETPMKFLNNAHEIAKKVGLKFVYLGNVEDHEFENTTCPNCANIVIKRSGFGVRELKIDQDGNCEYCGFPICIR